MLTLDATPCTLPPGAELAARLESEGYLVLPTGRTVLERIGMLWRAAHAFLALPPARKARNVLPEYDGYHPVGPEFSATPDRPDLAESFWCRLIHERETWRLPDEEARDFHREALLTSAALETLLRPLTERLARHYAEDYAPELAFACDRASHLQFNRYQPRAQTREILADAHEDGLYLTLLFADAPGLEVLTPAGVWQPLQPAPGELIAMPGEIFSLLCGYRVKPLLHRVRNHPEVERRCAMMYFANPNPVRPFRPWRQDARNKGVDIIARAIENPTRYGLPPLPAV